MNRCRIDGKMYRALTSISEENHGSHSSFEKESDVKIYLAV